MSEFTDFDPEFGPDPDLFPNRWRNFPAPVDYYPRPMGGGGKGGGIQGTLVDLVDGSGAFTGKKIATILIVVAPCNQPDLIGTEVEVVDWSGCVFDHELSDLDGVWVWASRGIAADTPCHWVADDRCCVDAD